MLQIVLQNVAYKVVQDSTGQNGEPVRLLMMQDPETNLSILAPIPIEVASAMGAELQGEEAVKPVDLTIPQRKLMVVGGD